MSSGNDSVTFPHLDRTHLNSLGYPDPRQNERRCDPSRPNYPSEPWPSYQRAHSPENRPRPDFDSFDRRSDEFRVWMESEAGQGDHRVKPFGPGQPTYGNEAIHRYPLPQVRSQVPERHNDNHYRGLPSDTAGNHFPTRPFVPRSQERIPTLRPGDYDGMSSWREFQRSFERCAVANNWSPPTMAAQLRFSLKGAAGNAIRKNRIAENWTYERMSWELDQIFGPRSKHAISLGFELRRRVRRTGESLYELRDDIQEKVSIVYGDRSEMEMDRISVEIFST
jgi:hypothetical protein